jgi:transcriptional regulator with XRE-family HTH domain
MSVRLWADSTDSADGEVKPVAHKVKEPRAAVKASAMAKFANQLRGWRAKVGLSQAGFADRAGYSNALVSQVEGERKPPSAEFAAKCDEVFGTPATFADLQELVAREAWPSYFAPVIDSETRAAQIHEWEQRVVPGLLQTEEYARSVIKAGQPGITPDELDRKVASRLERQEIFSRQEGRPMYWVVIHEGVLHQVIGSPDVMRAQLDRLVTAADSPDTVIQVLPFTAYEHPGTDGPILVFDYAEAPSSGYTECNGGGMLVEQREQVAALVTTMNLIRAAAMSRRESRQRIAKIRDGIT